MFGFLLTGIRGVLHSLPGRVHINFTGWRLREARYWHSVRKLPRAAQRQKTAQDMVCSLETRVFQHEQDEQLAKIWSSRQERSEDDWSQRTSGPFWPSLSMIPHDRCLFGEREMNINLFVAFHVWQIHIWYSFGRKHWLTVKAFGKSLKA